MILSDPSITGPRGIFGQIEEAKRDMRSANTCLRSPLLGLLVPRHANETRGVVLLLREIPHVLGVRGNSQICSTTVERIVIDVINFSIIWGLKEKPIKCEISVSDSEIVFCLRISLGDKPVSGRNEFKIGFIDECKLSLREPDPARGWNGGWFGNDWRHQRELLQLLSPGLDRFLWRREVRLPECLPLSDDPGNPVFPVPVDPRMPCAVVDPYLGHTWEDTINYRRDATSTSGPVGEC